VDAALQADLKTVVSLLPRLMDEALKLALSPMTNHMAQFGWGLLHSVRCTLLERDEDNMKQIRLTSAAARLRSWPGRTWSKPHTNQLLIPILFPRHSTRFQPCFLQSDLTL
jgi:hypothetical protein